MTCAENRSTTGSGNDYTDKPIPGHDPNPIPTPSTRAFFSPTPGHPACRRDDSRDRRYLQFCLHQRRRYPTDAQPDDTPLRNLHPGNGAHLHDLPPPANLRQPRGPGTRLQEGGELRPLRTAGTLHRRQYQRDLYRQGRRPGGLPARTRLGAGVARGTVRVQGP